ncbi:hypothetical protein CARUB_v10014591mg [Capsella rubella]|uniref:Ribosomal protein S2 n=1 Tax=Capsella rubella TaxID=81985 RepID=R0G7F2_9BRAS|nr:ribosomal protein S2, mitochondrial [Capsella rubella]EOA31411.1 hypothetical protein CARUB_v10014591mg [Capsella rubella]
MTIHAAVIQKLLNTGSHLGRRAAEHHFKQYAYGTRNGMTIIDSDKTLICLRSAAHFVANLAHMRGNIFFVNTNPLFDEIIELTSRRIQGDSYNHNRAMNLWKMGGFLTNSYSPKKFRSRHKKLCFGPTTMPDCVVVFDTERKSSVILEASKLQIPVVAIVDPNVPLEFFEKITYPVPARDSVKFVYLFCNVITKCFVAEQMKLGIKDGSKEDLMKDLAA